MGSEKKEIKTDLEGKKSLINELVKEIREDIRKNEIKHLMDVDCTARFGDWKIFAPELVFGTKKGYYSFDLRMIALYLAGKSQYPTRMLKNPLDGTIELYDPRTVNAVMPLSKFLDPDEQEYVVHYGEYQGEVQRSASRPKLYHTLREMHDGSIVCTCEGFRYRKTCRHIKEHELSKSKNIFDGI